MEWSAKTAAEGPLVTGLCINMTTGELAEWFSADPQFHEDPGHYEKAGRKVYPVGYIPRASTALVATPDKIIPYDDYNIPSWDIGEEEMLSAFVFNLGAQLTTGTLLKWMLSITGRFIGDI